MSAKLFLSESIIPQADFEATQEENGQWKANQSFLVKKGDFDNLATRLFFSRGKTPTDLDINNDAYFNFLKLKTTTVGTEVGGYTIIRVEFQGYSYPIGDPPENEKSYMTTSYRGSLKTVPITEHPKFVATSDSEKYMLGLLMSGEFTLNDDGYSLGRWIHYESDITTEEPIMKLVTLENIDNPGSPYTLVSSDSRDLAALIAKGVRDYEVGTYEYVVRWSSDEPLQATDIDKLGLVAEPLGNPVKPSNGTREWKLATLNQEQEGTDEPTYTIELVYQLSDKDGWDVTLYT